MFPSICLVDLLLPELAAFRVVDKELIVAVSPIEIFPPRYFYSLLILMA